MSTFSTSPNKISLLTAFKERFSLRTATAADIQPIAALETSSYPADEAASPDRLAWRQAHAGAFFKVCTEKDNDAVPVGFVCGTLTQDKELTHESMEGHDPAGSSLCIHSVVVAPTFRRQGIARAMLLAYAESVAAEHGPNLGDGKSGVKMMLLIAKAYLLKLYVSAGFELVGLSSVVHGQDPWFEMRRELPDPAAGQPFVQVDSFASEVLRGNPAAIVFSHGPAAASGASQDGIGDSDEVWMQRVADEFHLAETAFVRRCTDATAAAGAADGGTDLSPSQSPSAFDIRWFTPSVEVDLCGHATLAAAHALFATGRAPENEPIEFHTLKSGILTVSKQEQQAPHGSEGGGELSGQAGWLTMDFPSEPATTDVAPGTAEAVASALGVASGDVLFVKRNRFDFLVELSSDAFARMKPDLGKVKDLGGRGLCVTAAFPFEDSSSCYYSLALLPSRPPPGLSVQFVSRFFAPCAGIDEDPVTGSAHCALAPYWAGKTSSLGGGSDSGSSDGAATVAGKQEAPTNNISLVGWQASSRGGAVRVTMAEKGTRVRIAGQAVTAMDGFLRM